MSRSTTKKRRANYVMWILFLRVIDIYAQLICEIKWIFKSSKKYFMYVDAWMQCTFYHY